MKIEDILSKCDHTLLSQTATEDDIARICDEAEKYKTASACIPPAHVAFAKKYSKGAVKICTVIGFPNGYSTTATKVFEAKDALFNGADEFDMVINLGMLKACRYGDIAAEIRAVKEAVGGKILKVIIETCLLTNEEKARMCEVVYRAGADYIKTSTGFSTAGATAEDVDVFKKNSPPGLKIKAAGGISSLEDAKDFIMRGADRLGTSRIVRIIENDSSFGY